MEDFTETQMIAIQEMIATATAEATATLKNHNEILIGEQRAKAEEARIAREDKEAADRERLEKTGDVESYKQRVADLEAKIEENKKAITERDFKQSLKDAVAKHKVRADGLPDLFDLLTVRSQHKNGQTMVGVTPIEDYLTEYFNTDSGRHWIAPSGSSGSGAPGATSTSRSPTMTRENFNMTEFMNKPKAERDIIADSLGNPALKNL
ncbi:hypothetical protein QP179_09990 [Sphingomonas aurantiaca]|uniref:hypothetical protein n=1 Tax=Sphingomonas aurantiaca TaxID=185949 RepID=UPI002FE32DC8